MDAPSRAHRLSEHNDCVQTDLRGGLARQQDPTHIMTWGYTRAWTVAVRCISRTFAAPSGFLDKGKTRGAVRVLAGLVTATHAVLEGRLEHHSPAEAAKGQQQDSPHGVTAWRYKQILVSCGVSCPAKASSCTVPKKGPQMLSNSILLRQASSKRVSGQMGGGGRRPRKHCGESPRVPPSGASRPRAQNGEGSAAPPLSQGARGTF
jgi:hypothetical protein